MKNLETYYHKRALEHDRVYQKSERQKDLAQLKNTLPTLVKGKKVLDIGCGTGYWSYFLSQSAKAINGVDINQAVLDIAETRSYSYPTRFQTGSYYELSTLEESFETVFGGFVFSHVPKEKRNAFFSSVAHTLAIRGKLILLDNKYVAGSSTPIFRTDENENTLQIRKLESGETFEILKNFPEKDEFKEMGRMGFVLKDFVEIEYYWMAIIRKELTSYKP